MNLPYILSPITWKCPKKRGKPPLRFSKPSFSQCCSCWNKRKIFVLKTGILLVPGSAGNSICDLDKYPSLRGLGMEMDMNLLAGGRWFCKYGMYYFGRSISGFIGNAAKCQYIFSRKMLLLFQLFVIIVIIIDNSYTGSPFDYTKHKRLLM